MAQRVTNEDVRHAVEAYRAAAERLGVNVDGLTLAAPYGQVNYLCRWVDGGGHVHDLPGFQGSSGSGFVTKREAWERVWQAARVLQDVGYLQGR
jgi:hypothetical protein